MLQVAMLYPTRYHRCAFPAATCSLKWIAKFNFLEISWQKNKKDQTVQKPVNDYEKRRLLTVAQNKNKLRDLGVKNIANSLNSLVESKKIKKGTVEPTNINANDMDYIPNMDDDSEGDRQHIVTTSKNQHRPQFIPPMSMNKFANLAKHHRMIGPKVIKANVTKANYINVKGKRQLLHANKHDQTFHEDWRLVPNEVKMPLCHKLTTLFEIDMENSNVCKVVDSYMARAW
ncbi:hypothetical protein R6Q57_008409 [Mikania cordata]